MLMKKAFYSFIASAFILLTAADARSQNQPISVHEIAPFLGFYAPDRFETSTTFGLRYYYKIDNRFGIGAVLGFARAEQNFLRQVNGLTLQPGSDKVFYHGARATQSFPAGKVEPYLIFHLGLTRLYDENNFTFGFGLGTKISIHPKFSLRYEFQNYIFSSGRDQNSWTNKNLEVVILLGYYL
jgi:hypothetical protein